MNDITKYVVEFINSALKTTGLKTIFLFSVLYISALMPFFYLSMYLFSNDIFPNSPLHIQIILAFVLSFVFYLNTLVFIIVEFEGTEYSSLIGSLTVSGFITVYSCAFLLGVIYLFERFTGVKSGYYMFLLLSLGVSFGRIFWIESKAMRKYRKVRKDAKK